MSDGSFYDDGEVSVSSTMLQTPGQTYAMSGVTSVRYNRYVTRPNRTGEVALGIFGLLFGLPGLCLGCVGVGLGGEGEGSAAAGSVGAGLVLLLIAGALIAAAVAVWRRNRPVTWHVAAIASASGESRAFESTDEQRVKDIVEAIKQAILHRG